MLMNVRRLAGALGLLALVMVFSAPAGLAQVITGWQTESVDTEGHVGYFTSLALDSMGQPHISYIQADNVTLKYAAFDGTSWQTETVDSAGDVGWDTSLALDGDGRPHISYFDGANGDLKYAVLTGTGWQVETVDTTGLGGLHTSLALDIAGQPHISYADFANSALKYATFDGVSWQITTVDAEGDTGAHSSLALDAAGHPHISYLAYYDVSDTALRYAHVTFNAPPTVDAGGPYSGTEGSPISLDGTVSDREGDELTTAWSYTIDTADPGTTCTVNDASQVNTTFTCTDDGTFTLTLAADDGINAAVANTSTVTIANAVPTVMLGDDVTINQVDAFTGTGSFTDPGTNDTHTATVDYGDGSVIQPLPLDPGGSFSLRHTYGSAGQYTVEVCVIDDDAGIGCDVLIVQVTNQSPTVEAGGPYSGTEGSPVSLDVTVSDPESDELTTTWSYMITSADPGTTCAFADDGQVGTTFTCTDDGSVTLTLTVDDGINLAVIDTAAITLTNVAPAITNVAAALTGNQATVNITATDPGQNDVLGFAFDCDNDDDYDVGLQPEPSATCPLSAVEGAFTIGVQVSDDDGGMMTDSVTVTIATDLCANTYTGVLRYSEDCRDYETAITIPDPNGPVTVCASVHNGLLRLPVNGMCAGHEISYVLPEDGPLSVCVSAYTQTMRVVSNLGQCSSHEYGLVIAATEIGELPLPRIR